MPGAGVMRPKWHCCFVAMRSSWLKIWHWWPAEAFGTVQENRSHFSPASGRRPPYQGSAAKSWRDGMDEGQLTLRLKLAIALPFGDSFGQKLAAQPCTTAPPLAVNSAFPWVRLFPHCHSKGYTYVRFSYVTLINPFWGWVLPSLG